MTALTARWTVCIPTPIDLSDSIIRSFAAIFATLSRVLGVRELRLRRLAFVGPRRLCVIVSITLWDDVGKFEAHQVREAFHLGVQTGPPSGGSAP